MKVSIITKTSTYNYGAALQAYALQEYIESLGNECEHVNHAGTGKKRKVKIFDPSLNGLLRLPFKRQIDKGYACFEKFYDDHIHMGRRYANTASLISDPPKADVYVTGSDQVWNPRDEKGKFYLEFAPRSKKKISYAASIGDASIPEKDKPVIRDYLKAFDGISVRENSALRLLSELTDKKISVNCDPIFLLDREKWRRVEEQVPRLLDKYILCYLIYKPEWFNDWARELRKKTGLKVVFVGLGGFRPVIHDRYIMSAGPGEFLYLIDHAAAVITSSFHGTAFSILFGKQFIAIPDPKRRDRVHDLLKLCNLTANELFECDKTKRFNDYDHTKVVDVIDRERESSKQYLLSHIC